MPRLFKTLPEAMRYRMRHGITQTKLADIIGVHYRTIADALNGRSELTPKRLQTLGITRRCEYLVDGAHDAGQGYSMHPHRNTRPTPEQRAARLAALEAKKSTPKIQKVSNRQREVLELTSARIIVAVRSRLNPKLAWQTFKSTKPKGNIDAAWLTYCQQSGANPGETIATPAKAEPVLYGHLKPVDRGQDHRRPLQRGELRPVVRHVQPEVTVTGNGTEN